MIKGIHRILFYGYENSPFIDGDEVKVFYYTDLDSYSVTKNGVILSSGPTLTPPQTFSYPNVTTHYVVSPINDDGDVDNNRPDVNFCDGSTLVKAGKFMQTYPYAFKTLEENSASCEIVACNIGFSGAAEVVRPTTGTSVDGSITTTATSSQSGIRYTIMTLFYPDLSVDYASMSNTTGYFPDLGAGVYFIVAKDSKGCQAVQSVTLNAANNYGVRWRLEFIDFNDRNTRIDISQLDYAGSVVDVHADFNTPFTISLRGENEGLWTSVIATEAIINLISRTNFQFEDLFTQNDREFKVVEYKDTGSGLVAKWNGWIKAGLHQETYVDASNYPVSANATDGLVELRNITFERDSGVTGDVSLIKLIAFILAKTDLELNIHSSVNVFETSFSTGAGDDPLAQTYVNVENCFFNDDEKEISCLEVLQQILIPFGARLYQCEGAWKIECVNHKSEEYAYRVFDASGEYVSNSTFNPIVDFGTADETERAVWIQRSQHLDIVPAIGKADVVYSLVKDPYGFKNGSFERIIAPSSLPGYIAGYPGWTLVPNGNVASYVYIQANSPESVLKGNNSKYKLVFNSDASNTNYGEDAYVISEAKGIEYTASDSIKFSFDFFVTDNMPSHKFIEFTKFKYSLQVNGAYLKEDGDWTSDSNYQWIEVVIERAEFNKWQKIEIASNDLPGAASTLTTTTAVLRIMQGSSSLKRYSGPWEYFLDKTLGAEERFEEIMARDTTILPIGYKITMIGPIDGTLGGELTVLLNYDLISKSEWDDLETIFGGYRLEPDDVSTSNKAWVSTKDRVTKISFGDWLNKTAIANSFDNATLEFFPGGSNPLEEKTYSLLNNKAYKENQTVPVSLGDVPLDITNAKNIYLNYFKRSTGEPTTLWTRTNVSQQTPLLPMLARQRVEQGRRPRYKLTGTLTSDLYLGFNNVFQDGSRPLLPMGMTINEKRNEYTVELHEIELVDDTTSNPFNAEFVTTEFGQDFDI